MADFLQSEACTEHNEGLLWFENMSVTIITFKKVYSTSVNFGDSVYTCRFLLE